MNHKIITNNMLRELRGDVAERMSAERFAHTLGVEKCASELAEMYCPASSGRLRAAALLHDITKEYSFEKQLKICADFGIMLRDDEKGTPNTLHAVTAAAIIPKEYPDFSDDTVIGAVRWHATGRADMTIEEKILWVADYIEDGRRYDDCVKAREYLRSNARHNADVLDKTLLMALTDTVKHVRARGGAINSDTLSAIEYLTNSKNI